MNYLLNNCRSKSYPRSVGGVFFIASFVSVISLCVFQCAFSQSGSDTMLRKGSPKYSTGLESFAISDAEMPVLQNQAIRGSGAAAYRISQFYRFLKLDADESDRWLTIAAEDGDSTAQFSLGNLLSESTNEQQKLRGCYWLNKVRKAGSEKIKFLAGDKLLSLKTLCGESDAFQP
jgi:TPR repeat protein